MAMNKVLLAERLQEAGLGDYVDSILQYAKPCIRLHTQLIDDPASLPLGTSRIGGLPDLPPGAEWPTRNGRWCEFVAQINLSEAAAYDKSDLLPKKGVLFFFFDGLHYEDKDFEDYQNASETIIYHPGDINELHRVSDYPRLREDWQRHPVCSVTFETDWMLPGWGTAAAFSLKRDVFHFQPAATRGAEATLVETYMRLTYSLIPDEDQDIHHLLGYPQPVVQDDPLLYVVPGIWDGRKMNDILLAESILLLQISSDNDPGMHWGGWRQPVLLSA